MAGAGQVLCPRFFVPLLEIPLPRHHHVALCREVGRANDPPAGFASRIGERIERHQRLIADLLPLADDSITHRVVSKDGKVMTLTSKGTDAKGQQVHNVAVYDKQ